MAGNTVYKYDILFSLRTVETSPDHGPDDFARARIRPRAASREQLCRDQSNRLLLNKIILQMILVNKNHDKLKISNICEILYIIYSRIFNKSFFLYL